MITFLERYHDIVIGTLQAPHGGGTPRPQMAKAAREGRLNCQNVLVSGPGLVALNLSPISLKFD